MRLLAATAIVLLFGLIVTQASATTPTPVACEGRSGPFGNLAQPRVSISPREVGHLVVDWIIGLGPYDEPTCFVVERQVEDGEFEVAAIVGYTLGWGEPMYFDGAVEVTYRVYGANNETRSQSGEATISIPSHTPFVWPSTGVRGDVDCDFDVDVLDVMTLLQGIVGFPVLQSSNSCYFEPLPGESFGPWWRWGRTDFDCDGRTGSYDVIVLIRHIANLPLRVHRFCDAAWPR